MEGERRERKRRREEGRKRSTCRKGERKVQERREERTREGGNEGERERGERREKEGGREGEERGGREGRREEGRREMIFDKTLKTFVPSCQDLKLNMVQVCVADLVDHVLIPYSGWNWDISRDPRAKPILVQWNVELKNITGVCVCVCVCV